MKDAMEFIKSALILAVVVLVLGSCSEQDIKERAAKIESARKEGYSEGYDDGYERGAEQQRELDVAEFTLDTLGIRDVRDRVASEYGMTPGEAAAIYELYTWEANHDGITWKEYQKALEVLYFTASLFID